ncbi:MAG: hypothetical protein WBV69_01530 [Candidatus Sulfotelmatobacter sp.]
MPYCDDAVDSPLDALLYPTTSRQNNNLASLLFAFLRSRLLENGSKWVPSAPQLSAHLLEYNTGNGSDVIHYSWAGTATQQATEVKHFQKAESAQTVRDTEPGDIQ